MYSIEVRQRALAWIDSGSSLRAISRSTCINRSPLREWRADPQKALRTSTCCPRCIEFPVLPEPQADYAYLLGLYLGDGCISVGGDPAKGVWKLRVFCADAWPGLIEECTRAMQLVRPSSKVLRQRCKGCTEVASY